RAQLLSDDRQELGADGGVEWGTPAVADALRRRRPRPGRPPPRHARVDQRPAGVRPEPHEDGYAPRLRPLDPAGAAGRGQRGDDRVPEAAVDRTHNVSSPFWPLRAYLLIRAYDTL